MFLDQGLFEDTQSLFMSFLSEGWTKSNTSTNNNLIYNLLSVFKEVSGSNRYWDHYILQFNSLHHSKPLGSSPNHAMKQLIDSFGIGGTSFGIGKYTKTLIASNRYGIQKYTCSLGFHRCRAH